MYRHYPDHIGIFVEKPRLTVIHLVFIKHIHISYELEQPLIACFAVVIGFLQEHVQIGISGSPVVKSGNIYPVFTVDYLLKDIIDRSVSGH